MPDSAQEDSGLHHQVQDYQVFQDRCLVFALLSQLQVHQQIIHGFLGVDALLLSLHDPHHGCHYFKNTIDGGSGGQVPIRPRAAPASQGEHIVLLLGAAAIAYNTRHCLYSSNTTRTQHPGIE